MTDPQNPEEGNGMTEADIKALCHEIAVEVVNSEMDRLLAGKIIAAITDLQAENAALKAAEAHVMPNTAAERDVLTERSRQVAAEGWDEAHDDTHTTGELSAAAACYALLSAGWSRAALWDIWPKEWGVAWLKDCDQRRAKVKAAALLIADIERLDRARSGKGNSHE